MNQERKKELLAKIADKKQRITGYQQNITKYSAMAEEYSRRNDDEAKMVVYNARKLVEACIEAKGICEGLISEYEAELNK